MILVPIPGALTLELHHLVLDFNGTLAVDGKLCPGVAERLTALAEQLQIVVLTADTFGSAPEQLQGLPCELEVLAEGAQDWAKQSAVLRLGAAQTVAMGNGKNDRLMLQEAALGVGLLQAEGICVEALTAADIVCRDICDALDLLIYPKRIEAGLRV